MRAPAHTGKSAKPRLETNASPRTAPARSSGKREPASLRALLKMCATYMSTTDLQLIRAAYTVADAAHEGARRKSGEPFIEHPLAVARLLAELAMDVQGIAAAILHDTVEDTSLTLDDVQRRFGPIIANIVDGVTKFTAVELGTVGVVPPHEPIDVTLQREHKARQQLETVRKLFLAMGQEPRVVLLKLADRLHNLRTLDAMTQAQKDAKSHETLEIFAPLAGRIGLHFIKTELEDLAFYYLEPGTFSRIDAQLREEATRNRDWIERTCVALQRDLAAQGVRAIVDWRIKRPYRAYRDALISGMDVSGLHDLIAFRVIVDSKDECYQALGAIHHLWRPYDDRIRDYIANPKVNGYQSLHTSVFALDGRLVQIHIRTHGMHRAAQHGVAIHWLERAARREPVDQVTPVKVEEMPGWVTQLATWHHELGLSAAEFVATLRGDLLDEQVFVFTPKGELRELPQGSTVLDLAYQIHTEIGSHAIAAYIQANARDGVLTARDVPVDYVLHTGDVVKVITAPEARPDPSWLDIVRTRYAHEKISRALRALRRADEAESWAAGTEPTAESEPDGPMPLRHPSGKPAAVALARCCGPCPGDAIAGVVGRGRTVVVHRSCCRTLRRTLGRRATTGAPYATPLHISWPEIQPITYSVHMAIEGQDYEGLMHEISNATARMGLNVSASKAYANQSRYKAAVTLTLDLPPEMRLDTVLRRLHTVPGIVSVRRDMLKGCSEAQG